MNPEQNNSGRFDYKITRAGEKHEKDANFRNDTPPIEAKPSFVPVSHVALSPEEKIAKLVTINESILKLRDELNSVSIKMTTEARYEKTDELRDLIIKQRSLNGELGGLH